MQIAGREVQITNPDKVFFPAAGYTKGDLVDYYLAVAEGALRGVSNRPMALKRFVHGADGEAFFQKRAPANRPPWIETAVLSFPSGRTAEEIVVRDAAQLAWVVNLGCIDLNPHPVRSDDLDHPDELRIDLDPMPGVPWSQVREVALAAKSVLDDMGLTGWPKTSGSRGMHIYCRIERRWTYPEVRRAAVAFAREVERRAPTIATSKWWKEERHGVFLDYNQNAKDRTIASAYSVRPTPDARVSTPLRLGRGARLRARGFHAGDGAGPIRRHRRSRSRDRCRSRDRSMPCSSLPRARRRPGCRTRHGLRTTRGSRGRRRGSNPHAPAAAPVPSRPRLLARKQARPAAAGPRCPLSRSPAPGQRRRRGRGSNAGKSRHPEVVPYLEPADVLVDAMRGRSSAWYRIRVNLTHVPAEKRPPQEPLEADYDPWAAYRARR